MQVLRCFILFLILVAQVGFGYAGGDADINHSNVVYEDLSRGSGMPVVTGSIVTIHFIGWVDDNGRKGKEVFNTYTRGKPVVFKVGTPKVIQGWNEGVLGMRAGGKRLLKVPARLGYNAKGASDVVPPDADLIYEIELVEVK